MPMKQEAEAKKFALKRIKEYARAMEADKMRKPTLKENMEQADSSHPALLASALDPKKAVAKSIPPSAMSSNPEDGPNETEGDNEPRKEPKSGGELSQADSSEDEKMLISEYERLSKKVSGTGNMGSKELKKQRL